MLTALFLACTGSEPITVDQPKSLPSVVLITMDTTRQDRIGSYGYSKAKTETIDSFADKGYRFDNAYSTVPLTTPAHASMLTGLYPPHHGIRSNGDAILPEDILTITEHLQSNGYDTAASISAFVTTRIWNLDQGFDQYFDTIERQKGNRWAQERNAGAVVNDLIGWLDTREDNQKPFFMWAHFYDPHHPHVAEEGYEEGFDDIYDAEIAYMDDQIERLRLHIEQQNNENGTIWVLLADHGEAFNNEHGESSHGMFLYDETVKIPMIIQPYPPLETTRVLQEAVSIVDLPNTMLGLLELPLLPDTDGHNVLQMANPNPVYIESRVVQQRFGYHPELAVITDKKKFMPTPNPRLYDLQGDPNEEKNIFVSNAELTSLQEYSHNLYQATPRFSTDSPDASVMKHLEALGYMGGDYESEGLSTYSIDAKDRIETIQELEAIVKGKKTGLSPEEIISRFESIIEKEPQLSEARLMLSQTLSFVGRKEEAITVLEEALALNPSSVVLALNLANQYAERGDYTKGIDLLDGILEKVPADNGARTGILKMLSDAEKHKEALAKGSQWLQESPSPSLQAILGVILIRDRQFELGEELLLASLSDEVHREHVHRSLGHISLNRNDIQSTIQHYEKELENYPDPDLQRSLASIYSRIKDWDNSKRHFCHLSETMPKASKVHLDCAQALFNLEKYEEADIVLQKALQLHPNGPFILLLAANIEAKIGDPQKAQSMFEQAKKAKEKWDEQLKGYPSQVPKQ